MQRLGLGLDARLGHRESDSVTADVLRYSVDTQCLCQQRYYLSYGAVP